jgi:hypothetical protein
MRPHGGNLQILVCVTRLHTNIARLFPLSRGIQGLPPQRTEKSKALATTGMGIHFNQGGSCNFRIQHVPGSAANAAYFNFQVRYVKQSFADFFSLLISNACR